MFLTRMMTTRNVGVFDRFIRVLPALATAWAWWSGLISGGWLIMALVASGMLLVTSATGACSIYYMLGLSTRTARSKPD